MLEDLNLHFRQSDVLRLPFSAHQILFNFFAICQAAHEYKYEQSLLSNERPSFAPGKTVCGNLILHYTCSKFFLTDLTEPEISPGIR